MSYYFKRYSMFDEVKTIAERPLGIGDEFYSLIAETYGYIGKLDGLCQYAPNVDLYIKLLMTQDACASSALENKIVRFYDFFGTTASLKESQFASNLLKAMKHGQNGTFSESLLKNIHGIVMTSETTESSYRDGQGGSPNDLLWSYSGGTNPVPANWIPIAMKDLQKYASGVNYQNALIMAAEIQYKLEVLDPFCQYSRAIARIISMFILQQGGLLSCPVLWTSDYLLDFKVEYKDRILAAYKQGEELLGALWVKFFLTGVNTSAKKAICLIETLVNARQTHIEMLRKMNSSNKSILAIYDFVANTVIVNVRQIADEMCLSFSNVTKVIKIFEEAGILQQVTQKERYRLFGYVPVLNLIKYH